jgi:hypothetical protein
VRRNLPGWPAAEHCTSILTDDSVPGEETWTHLWVSAVRFPGEDVSSGSWAGVSIVVLDTDVASTILRERR